MDKKFNLTEAFNKGNVMTKSGKKVKVICKTNGNKLYCLVKSNISPMYDKYVKYNMDGSRWSSNQPNDEDLIMA